MEHLEGFGGVAQPSADVSLSAAEASHAAACAARARQAPLGQPLQEQKEEAAKHCCQRAASYGLNKTMLPCFLCGKFLKRCWDTGRRARGTRSPGGSPEG